MERQPTDKSLGGRLRTLREERGWSLREVAARARVNHGYLSQLERGEVSEPAPSILHKLAEGYREPFIVLMQWAGYVEEGLSPNQARALSYLGENPSDEEVLAIKAILDVLRAKRATFAAHANSLDMSLTPADRADIRMRSVALLERADAYGQIPTPLDQLISVSQLVTTNEIILDFEEKQQLRQRFGDLVDRVINKLQGAVHLKAREVWVQPELYLPKKRFVTAHEIGHDLLPWQRDSLAYLDDEQRLRADVKLAFERQANQAAIELLTQGDRLRDEADDSNISMSLIAELSVRYEISIVATVRRVVEETCKQAALVIRFYANGRTGPNHTYCSKRFAERFGWNVTGAPLVAKEFCDAALKNGSIVPFTCIDRSGNLSGLQVESSETAYALIALFTASSTPLPARPLL